MATLPGTPFKVGMGVYSWAEDKLKSTGYPMVEHLGIRALEQCKDHPFIGIFVALTAITTLGPFTLFAGFLLFSNTCLLMGFALVEFLLIIVGLSVFIPAFLVAIVFSFMVTISLALVHKIWIGNEQKRNKLRKSKSSKSNCEFTSASVRNPTINIEEEEDKVTQTTEWVETTGQTAMRTGGQIDKIPLSTLIDEVLNNGEESAGVTLLEDQ